MAGRPDLRQATVTPQESLARRSLFTGLAVLAYWLVEPLVAQTIGRIGLSGLADLLALLLGVLGTIGFVAIFVIYLRHDGLADLRLRLAGGLRYVVIAIVVVILSVFVVRFVHTWASGTSAPIVTPTPRPSGVPAPTATPGAQSTAGETNGPAASGVSVTTAGQAANTFGGAQNRWDNIGNTWVLSKGKQTNLTIPAGWAATYVDNSGTTHGCPADGAWIMGQQDRHRSSPPCSFQPRMRGATPAASDWTRCFAGDRRGRAPSAIFEGHG